MRYRRLTPEGDYTFGGNAADFWINSPDGVAQAVVTRLKLWVGEWFLDVTEGKPYQVTVLGKHTKESADPSIRERILGTQGVTEITEYDSVFEPESRSFTVNARINTIYGAATVQGVL